jgi:hypothetical protein
MNAQQLDEENDVHLQDASQQARQLSAIDLELVAGGQATVNTI